MPKYTLKPTRSDHPIKLRPFLHELREELQKLEAPLLNDLAIIEARVLDRRHTNPTPSPDPVPPAPVPPTTAVDMMPLLQPTGDQGQQGSCFAFAGTHAQNLCEALALSPSPAPSPVTYSEACLSWNTRVLMGTSDQDSGGNLGDAIQAQEQTGTSLSGLMPYNQDVFNVPPDAAAVADEANHKAKFRAYPIDTSDAANITQALSDGYPVYMGFNVPQSFEDLPAGTAQLPDPTGEPTLGGHAGLWYYDAACPAGYVAEQNSWSSAWGVGGRCQMPLAGYLPLVIEAFALVPLAG